MVPHSVQGAAGVSRMNRAQHLLSTHPQPPEALLAEVKDFAEQSISLGLLETPTI